MTDSPWRARAFRIAVAGIAGGIALALLSRHAAAQTTAGVTVDLTVNIPVLISLAVISGGGIAAWVTVRLQVAANKAAIADLRTGALAKLDKDLAVTNERLEATSKRIEEVRAKGAKELADFKLEVAQRYATGELIKEVEERLIEAINRLGDRFDRYVDGQPAPGRRRVPHSE